MIPIVTLLTDFGHADPWVAAVKGVFCSEWERWPEDVPRPRIIDLGHEVPRGDIEAAAWFLEYAAPEYPAGTVHCAVIDPGVGGERPALAVEIDGQFFVGPGNGLFRGLVDRAEIVRVVELDRPEYQRPAAKGAVSGTFHGRDIFAPAAAHLAMGVPLEQVGSPADPGVVGMLPGRGFPVGSGAANEIWRIRWIDHFGNAISDLRRDSTVGRDLDRGREVEVADRRIPGPVGAYVLAEPGLPFWYWGSGGTLEIAVRDASASAQLGLEPGLALHVPGQ